MYCNYPGIIDDDMSNNWTAYLFLIKTLQQYIVSATDILNTIVDSF